MTWMVTLPLQSELHMHPACYTCWHPPSAELTDVLLSWRVERLIQDAQGKQTEDSLRKLAREAAKVEVNAHHGLVGECH